MVDVARIGKDAIETLCVNRREWRLVEALDFDTAVLPDVVLKDLKESQLLRCKPRVLMNKGRVISELLHGYLLRNQVNQILDQLHSLSWWKRADPSFIREIRQDCSAII